MKELTIEQKAKAYDEAIKRASKLRVQNPFDTVSQMMEHVYPELKESEDEKIRKSLIILLQHFCKGYRVPGLNFSVSFKEMLAWLEKQGEQKPSDKVEPFDKYEGLTDFEKNLADICIGWIGEELGWKQYIKDNADVLLRIAVEKFNSVQDAPFKQNPAWSEEDEKIRQNLMSLLSDMRGHRIEESTYQKYYPWLKSLKERYAWKPSDEQIRALEYIIDNVHNTSYSCKIVKELLEQLKKLKGE